MGLIQLIYASQPFGFDDAMLNGILLDARRCNRRDGVSGMLICRADLYLQYLEGPEETVEKTFARIARDDRHCNITRLGSAALDARLFPDWDMQDDPARSWMWSQDQVAAGAVEQASLADLVAVFSRAGRETAAA
jgi:hypothetical protein